jgi:hypothetical protein
MVSTSQKGEQPSGPTVDDLRRREAVVVVRPLRIVLEDKLAR